MYQAGFKARDTCHDVVCVSACPRQDLQARCGLGPECTVCCTSLLDLTIAHTHWLRTQRGSLADIARVPAVQVSSLLVAGWAGLVVNALNTLPVGELDGGRMALALFGRR